MILSDALFSITSEIRDINKANGWYDTTRDFATDTALLHSEVSEAFEAWRKDEPGHVKEEMADIFIRLIDSCDRLSIDLAEAVIAKCKKNRTRSYRHGGKRV
jgi:NTP pyrophosphatase (non-canonical NTP hydrolase)